MKKILILAIGILLSFGSMVAQNQRRGEGHDGPKFSVKERVEEMKKELKLSDEQTEQVTTLFENFQNKIKEVPRGDRQKMRAELEDFNKSIEQILNDDQKAAYKKMQERNRPSRGDRGERGNRGGLRGGRQGDN